MIKPNFTLNNFPDVKGPEGMFPSAKEQPGTHSVACRTPLLSSDKQKGTANLSCAHNEDETIWCTGASVGEGLVPSGSRVKWTQSVSNLSGEAAGGIDKHHHSELNTTGPKKGHLSPFDIVTKEMGQTVAEAAERGLSQEPQVQSEATKFILEDNDTHNLDRGCLIAAAMENRTELRFEESTEDELEPQQLNCFVTQDTDIHRINTDVQKMEEVRLFPEFAGE